MMDDVIQSMWIGERLNALGYLTIQSFLKHGHRFHLYAYSEIDNVPLGVEVKDGRDILPESDFFVYRTGFGAGSPSAFSNLFRYKLLLDRGGWWVDMDSICLKPFAFSNPYVVGYQRTPDNGLKLGAGIIRAPAGSELMQFCYREASRVDKDTVKWGEIGPDLLTRAVGQCVPDIALDPNYFYPINHWEAYQLFEDVELPENAHSVHLWNARWSQYGWNSERIYPVDTLIGRLQARFAGSY